MNKPVYFDYAAATPTDKRVIDAMVKCLSIEGTFANPHAKDHVYGWQAAEAVEKAREQVANLIGESPLEITFTSGATESNNLAIFGLAQAFTLALGFIAMPKIKLPKRNARLCKFQ